MTGSSLCPLKPLRNWDWETLVMCIKWSKYFRDLATVYQFKQGGTNAGAPHSQLHLLSFQLPIVSVILLRQPQSENITWKILELIHKF